MYSEQEVKRYMENGIKSEQEEPPEDEMIDIANEFVEKLEQVTGKSLEEITNALPDYVPFGFSSYEGEIVSGGHPVRGTEMEEEIRNALGVSFEEVENNVFNELPDKISDITVEDSLYPVSISFDWDFTEHTVQGEPGDWEVVI